MDSQHPDQAFDKALTNALRWQAETRDDCPDPDIMAAFWDRSLSSDERARWEAHFARCARCRSQLAALARTAETEAPAADPVVSHLGWLFDWHWFAAISTAAIIVVALWVADPGRLTDGETPTVADSETVRLAEDSPAERAQAAPPAAAEPRIEAESLEARSRVAQRENAAEEADAAAVDELTRLDRQKLAAGEETQGREQTEPAETTEPRPAALAERSLASRAPADFADTAAAQVVTAPNRSIRWRFAAGAAIERSTDGGASWVIQLADPSAQLTDGFAPSDSVCWLVGLSGAVFRTTDGVTWERLPAPATADLVRIVAEDAFTAIVTTADGTAYRTTDGGQTWLPQ